MSYEDNRVFIILIIYSKPVPFSFAGQSVMDVHFKTMASRPDLE